MADPRKSPVVQAQHARQAAEVHARRVQIAELIGKGFTANLARLHLGLTRTIFSRHWVKLRQMYAELVEDDLPLSVVNQKLGLSERAGKAVWKAISGDADAYEEAQ